MSNTLPVDSIMALLQYGVQILQISFIIQTNIEELLLLYVSLKDGRSFQEAVKERFILTILSLSVMR
jgi:hypothetical protein